LNYDPKIIDTRSQMMPIQKNPPAAIVMAPAPPIITEDPVKAMVDDTKKGKGKDKEPHDKVKVAKNIVKDMEKWAKQLNQKKNMNTFQAPIQARDDVVASVSAPVRTTNDSGYGYADVGFSILEKKEKAPPSAVPGYLMSANNAAANSKLVSYGSDSDNEQDHDHFAQSNEKDYLDFEKLTCLLCKRAFQSLEIFNKHLKMSQLHKENLQKHNLQKGITDVNAAKIAAGYRDRAKERRLKYGEVSPPPVNKSKERFQREMEKTNQRTSYQAPVAAVAATPIGENNVGNKLLQKMGWKDGQGLGRSNQGRTQIIEVSDVFFFVKFPRT
jgi:RNA-binding protein 5/10